MEEYEWVIIDTVQIQSYVYRSNLLREIIGASYLVKEVTKADRWAAEAICKVIDSNKVCGVGFNSNGKIEEDSSFLAEVLYSGGGNLLIIFKQRGLGNLFIRELSKLVLSRAPGLQVVAISEVFDWDDFFPSLKIAWENLGYLKNSRLTGEPQGGLSITRACSSIGLPAVEWGYSPKDSDHMQSISAEAAAKRLALDNANKLLNNSCQDILEDNYEFPYELDQLGRSKAEFSYIAILHIDGDGIGDRIQKIANNQYSSPREYIETIRKFSISLEEAGKNALNKSLDTLIGQIDDKSHSISHFLDGRELSRVNLSLGEFARWRLPVRPILYGGDDLTLVCDGRVALSFAESYISAFYETTASLPDKKGPASASGGVAIVKSHYPFAHAYQLAENLKQTAKDYRKEINQEFHYAGGCLDWHISNGGLYGDISQIRHREYTVPTGKLTLRPIVMDANPKDEYRSWNNEKHLVEIFQGNKWHSRRNKLKALRNALRGGNKEVETFLLRYANGELLEPISDIKNFSESGWFNGYCGYYDAIELSDWFIPFFPSTRRGE